MDIVLERILACMGPKHGAVKELAEHLGISPNVITNWKNGSLRSYRKYLPQIAAYYGVSAAWLCGTQTVPDEPADVPDVTFDDFTYAMLGETQELTEENKQKLLEMARFFRQQQEKEINKAKPR